MKRASYKVKIFFTILGCLFLTVIIFINVTLIVKAFLYPKQIPDVLGISPLIVLSGSMAPTFDAESLIFVENVGEKELGVGDVVTYLVDEVAVTHRIVGTKKVDGEIRFEMKGDANDASDSELVSEEQVEGRYVGHVKGLGGFFMFMQTPLGIFLFGMLPIIIAVTFILDRQNKELRNQKFLMNEMEKSLKHRKEGKD